MIAANELRIGSWVNHNGKPMKVLSVESDIDNNALPVMENGRDFYRMSFDTDGDLQPIPLTPEILEKCGFELKKSDNWTEYRLGIIGFDFNHSRLSGCHIGGEEYHYIEVSYLHQLQNLYFAITGRELEVEL